MAALQAIQTHPKTHSLLEDLQKLGAYKVSIEGKGIMVYPKTLQNLSNVLHAHELLEYCMNLKKYKKPKRYHGLHCGVYSLAEAKIERIQ